MRRYLDPKYDLTFKRIFGEHKHLCISLINSMLPFDESRRVEKIEYQTGELMPRIENLKHSVVDVRCTDNYNRQFIVEMQMSWTESFKKRVLLNASKAYVQQFDSAQDYRLLYPVYAINFVDDIFEKSPEMREKYYHHYQIVNIQHTEKRIEGLELIFIELPKFKPHTRATRKLHELWLRFLTEINESTEEAPAELLSDKDIREAVHYSEVGAYDKNQLLVYDKIRMAVMDERSLLSGSREEGWVKGREEGREEGRAESRVEIATNALKKGLSPVDASELTGLPLNEILALKDNL
jgi:predicted transposase/invertase (TIGR01784 family)